MSAKFSSSSSTSTSSSSTVTSLNLNAKNKKTSHAFQFLRSKPPINPIEQHPVVSQPPAPPQIDSNLKQENENEEFRDADQFDFEQMNQVAHHVPKIIHSVNSSLSSSQLSES